MQIQESLIERIKEENDIVDIISETVRLKRSGRNYTGLCPFHSEKSPSFSVSQDKQIYKCFGCGEAGNVITFVMKSRKLDFIEALKILADRANIPLNLENKENSAAASKKELMYKINTEAARFYFSNLFNDKEAMSYFQNRGLSIKTIRSFGLGFSKNQWNNLMNFLKRKGYKEEILESLGLIIKSEKTGNYYDRFRNRVMFPVFDFRGRIIGFGGRVLDDSKPKYLNSPDSLIFSKGTNLYGLNFAIKDGLPERYFVIVEGYMDCISLHQHGIKNAVASLGTALTTNQARLMKRYADKVIISYDADLAGQNATLRGLDILKNAGFDVRVLTVPQGKDPDEYIRSNGKEAFMNLIEGALPLIEYRLKKVKEGINFSNNEDVILYSQRVTEILAELNPVEKDVYVKKISEETGIREQALYDQLSDNMTKFQKEEYSMNNKEENGTKSYIEPAYLKGERALLKLMLKDEYFNFILENITESELILKAHREIYGLIVIAKTEKKNGLESYVENNCKTVDAQKEWIEIEEMDIFDENMETSIKDYIYNIRKHRLDIRKEDVKRSLKESEDKGVFEETISLAKELKDIDIELKRLKRG
ncbi:DNA primase [Clostridium paridis]|uniref:DNA primase n=1 Tax=Clostridium paridis TaxID=2803863 RepID=A0A937K605_9CLOT|nr:DNA primase [Clostridium paridis]MBL4933015.1 DNA primase [Clostridium paridis]